MSGKKVSCDGDFQIKGRNVFRSSAYDPAKVDRLAYRGHRIKHTERFQSGTRRFDDINVQITTTLAGYESLTFSRKASLDGNAFISAKRASPVLSKFTWPGGEIQLKEDVLVQRDNVKIKVEITTPFDQIKTLKYNFSANGQGSNDELKFEGMGGYVEWKSKVDKKQRNQFDVKCNVKSNWIPKTQADLDISIKAELPESLFNVVLNYGGSPILKLESKATKTGGKGVLNIDLKTKSPLKVINGGFSGEVNIVNSETATAKLKLTYNTKNVEVQLSRGASGGTGKIIKATVSGSSLPTTTLTLKYSAERITSSNFDVVFEIQNKLSAIWKCGISGRKLTGQAMLKGALISNREYTFISSLDLSSSKFLSKITWTEPNVQNKKEIKLIMEYDAGTTQLKMKFVSPFVGYENVSFLGTKSGTAHGSKFTGTANVNNIPAKVELEYTLKDDSSTKDVQITWNAKRGAKYISVAFTSELKTEADEHKLKSSLSVTGSEFAQSSIEVQGEYEPGKEIELSVDLQTPIAGMEKLGANFEIEFESPKEFDFQVKVYDTDNTIFEFQAQLAGSSDKRIIKFNVIAPELGLLNENALRIELVYHFTGFNHVFFHQGSHQFDFEVSAAVALFGKRNEAKIKLQRHRARQIDNNFPEPSTTKSFAGDLLFYSDWLKQHHFGNYDFSRLADMSVKFGLEKNRKNVPVLGVVDQYTVSSIYRCYLNNNELKIEIKEKGELRGQNPYRYFRGELSVFEVNFKMDLQYIVDIIHEFMVPSVNPITAKLNMNVLFTDMNRIKVSVTLPSFGANGQAKVKAELAANLDSRDNRFLEKIFATLDIDMFGFKKSGSVLVERDPNNNPGENVVCPTRFEITFGSNNNDRIKMAMSTVSRQKRGARVARSANFGFASPDFGNFDFELSQEFMKGVLVLSTPRGLHKVSYEISDKNLEINNDYSILFQIETPFLDQGRAQMKLNIGNPKYTENPADGFNVNYRGQLSLNNKHFISAAFKMDTASGNKGFDTSFAIETSYLPEDWSNLQMKVNAWLQEEPNKATAKLYFRHGATRHEFDGVIDAGKYEMNVMLTSPLLNYVGGHTKWELEGRLSKYQRDYSADLLFKVSDENLVQLSFQATINGLTNFEGSVYYHAPNLKVSQAKVTYKVLVNEDKVLFDVDLTSSGNVDFPRSRVFLEWERSTNRQSYEGSFKIISPTGKLPSLDGNITVPHISYLLKNTIRIQMYAPSGQHSIISEWDIQFHDIRGESKFSAKYIGPYGSKKVFADFGMKYIGSDQYGVGTGSLQNLRLYDVQIEANVDASTFGHKISTTVASKGGVGLLKGDVDLKTNYNDDKIECQMSYNFIDPGKKLTGKLKTPFVGYEQYGFELAFENSNNQKTAKAHATWPGDKFGVQFDFGVISVSDFVIHVQLDVPIPGLSFKTLHVENKIKNRSQTFIVNGKWGSKSLGIKSVGYSTPFNGKVTAEANLNEHAVKLNVDKYNAIGDIKCSIKGVKLPWFGGSLLNFQTDVLRDRSTCNAITCEKVEFKHQANGKRYIYLSHNPSTGTVEMEFQRMLSNNMQFKTAATYDTTADENGYKVLEVVETYKNLNDPNGKYIKTNFFLRCQEQTGSDNGCPKVEFSFKTLWPSKDVSELRGYLHHDLHFSTSNLRYNLEYIQNTIQMLKYEATSESVYNTDGMETKQRSTLVIPSHKFMQNGYYRARLDGTVVDQGQELEWGKTNEGADKMKKIGFGFSQNKVWELGLTESKLVFKRRIQGDVNQVMTFRFTNGFGADIGNGDKYKEVEFKAQHPSVQLMNWNMKMRFEHNCNHETSKAKLTLKRKWGNERNFSEFTAGILLNKIDGSVVIDSVLPDGTTYKMEGAITASNVLGELRHGFSATVSKNGKLDRSFIVTVYPVIHALQLESVKFDERDKNIGKTFKMFAGFVNEEAEKFAVRLTCDDQMTTINHFIDHSVASLVNAIDGIGNSTDEISILVSLSEDGDNLAANVTWPPHLANSMSNLLQKTKTALQQSHDNSDNFGVSAVREIRKVGNVFENTMNAVFSDILYILDGGEVVSQYEKVVTFLSKNIREAGSFINIHTGIGNYFESQFKSLGTVIGYAVKTSLNVVKSLHSTISSFANGMVSFANSQLTYLHTAIVEIRKEVLKQIIDFIPDEIDIQLVSDCIKDAAQYTRTTILRLSRAYRQFVTRFSSKIEFAINDFLVDVNKDFKLIAKEFSRNFKQFKALRKMVQFYYDYQSWLEEIHFSEHLERTTQEVERYIASTMVHFEDLRILASTYLTEASNFVYSHYVTISSYPPVAFAGSLVKKAGVLTLRIIANPDVLGSYKLRRLASKILARVDAVASTTVRLIDVLFHGSRDFISYDMNFKPAEGHFEYNQVLPFTWYSFKDTPDIVKLADLSVDLFKDDVADDDLDVDMIEFQHELLEAIDTVSQAITTRTIMPPFAATGFIAGDSHLQTFDGKFYDFVGAKGCSYLLVSDFLHNRFSVFATYNGTTRSSISVISDNKVIKIDDKIDPNDRGVIKVTVDRHSVELPMTFNHTYIKREGSTITVEHSEGLRVICNVIHRVCTVTVSGWYFGKTGGLLGVYDNEVANDWMTSDREVASTLDAFVTSWHIDDGVSNGANGHRHCPVKQSQNILLQTLEQDATVWEMETCNNIFGGRPDVNSVSPLMPCYSTVDPKPYRNMCLKEMRKVRNRPEQMVSGTCLAAAAYVQQCKLLGVELWMPNECITCEEASISFQPGESTTIKRSSSPIQMPSSADVVFVVEQKHTCNNAMYTENLRDLPKLIDKSLKEKPSPITNNRFAVVGYGSGNERTGSTPHIFTISSSIFSSSNNVQFAMNRLQSTGRRSNYSSDVFSALKYAARLPFRPGVSKTIVLVTCDNSGKNDGSFYGDAMTMLKEGGITLHHLSPARIDVGKRSWISKKLYKSKSKISAKKDVFGYNRNAAFTANGQADSVLRKQINNPKDYLSTLAIQSGKGNVFDLTKLDQTNRVTAKKASLVMAKNIAASGGSPPECQVCDCLVNKDGEGSLQCSVCIMPEMDLVQESWQIYGKYWNN